VASAQGIHLNSDAKIRHRNVENKMPWALVGFSTWSMPQQWPIMNLSHFGHRFPPIVEGYLSILCIIILALMSL